MKDIHFIASNEPITTDGDNIFVGIGKVNISSSDGDVVVIAHLIEGGLWRVVISSLESDRALPQWRSTYSIDENGVMAQYTIHAPDDANTNVDESHNHQ